MVRNRGEVALDLRSTRSAGDQAAADEPAPKGGTARSAYVLRQCAECWETVGSYGQAAVG